MDYDKDENKNRLDDAKDLELVDLNEGEISKLRWLVLSYLNMFESILVAWQYSAANRKIIEAQFSYLFDPANGSDALSNFRRACGGTSCYPAIEAFAAHVQKEKQKRLIKKGNIV